MEEKSSAHHPYVTMLAQAAKQAPPFRKSRNCITINTHRKPYAMNP